MTRPHINAALTPAGWPPTPDLHARRWLLHQLAQHTNELVALHNAAQQLTRLLHQPLAPDPQLAQQLTTISLTFTAPNHNHDSQALLDRAPPHHPHLTKLLTTTLQHRHDLHRQLRQLTATPIQLAAHHPLTVHRDHLQPLLTQLNSRIHQLGHTMAHTDQLLTDQLTHDHPHQPTP